MTPNDAGHRRQPENGPGNGYHWLLKPAPTDAPGANCGVGAQNSWNFYADTWQVQSASPSLSAFTLALQATGLGSVGCSYTPDGRFTCVPYTLGTDLSKLPAPYTMDAVVSMKSMISGRFRERVAPDPATDADHTYSARWAADLDLRFEATCTGTACASAAAGMGASGFPCTSAFSGLESLNYSDPTLTSPL